LYESLETVEERAELAKKLIEHYIRTEGNRAINIEGGVQQRILQHYNEYTMSLTSSIGGGLDYASGMAAFGVAMGKMNAKPTKSDKMKSSSASNIPVADSTPNESSKKPTLSRYLFLEAQMAVAGLMASEPWEEFSEAAEKLRATKPLKVKELTSKLKDFFDDPQVIEAAFLLIKREETADKRASDDQLHSSGSQYWYV